MTGDPPAQRSLFFFFGFAKFVMATATRFVYAFLPALARGLGVSVESFGILVSVRWIAGMTTPVVVYAAGGEDRRRIAVVGLGLFVAGSIVTAATGAYVGAMVGFAMAGVASYVFTAAMQASVADRVPYARRGRILGAIESTWSLSFLVGAPVAGWLITVAGWEAPFWATGLAAAGVAPFLLRGMRRGAVQPADGGTIRWNASSVGFLVATVALVGSVEMVFVSYAAWLETTHGFGVEALALVAVAIGVGELAAEAAVALVTDRVGKRRAVAVGMVVSATAYLFLAVDPGPVGAVAVLVLGITGFEFALVSAIPLGTELQPQARISFLSRFFVAQSAGRAVAALGGLSVYAMWTISGVGIVAAAVAGAGAVVMVTVVREHGAVAGSEA